MRLYDCSSIAGRNNPPVVVNSQERQKLGCGTLKEGGEVERANRIEVASGRVEGWRGARVSYVDAEATLSPRARIYAIPGGGGGGGRGG